MNTAEALELVAARDAERLAALEAERARGWPPPADPQRQRVRQILLLVHKASTG